MPYAVSLLFGRPKLTRWIVIALGSLIALNVVLFVLAYLFFQFFDPK
jgi:hypothetical protein